MKPVAVIVGVGRGLSAALARRLYQEGFALALMARDIDKLRDLTGQTNARAYPVDASAPAEVAEAFASVDAELGSPELVIYNAGDRYRGFIDQLDPERVRRSYEVAAFGGFLVAQQAARRMLETGRGSIFFTGATAAVKALPGSVPFAMGKFALRALAQSLARELAPRNIHVAHFVIDGQISTSTNPGEDGPSDQRLWPEAIADSYLHVHRQHRSAWTWEVELRPWTEHF